MWASISSLPVYAELKFQVLSRLLSAAAECSERTGVDVPQLLPDQEVQVWRC